MTDDILTLNESGEVSVRTTSSAGDTSTNKNDVYTRDSQGRLAVRVVGATGGGGGSVSGDYVRQYSAMPEPNSAGDIVQYIGNSAPYNHGAFYESVAQSGGTYAWQEITVDNLLEAMVENNASVLQTTKSLSANLGVSINVSLSQLTAFAGLDARPSHKDIGAVVFDPNGRIGIIDHFNAAKTQAYVMTIYLPASGLPTINGAYKVLGTDTTTSPKWIEAMLIADFQPSDVSAGYLGTRPFISKTGAYDAVQNQSYIVSQQSVESKYTLVSDTSNGQIKIVDPTAFYAFVQERWLGSYGGYGSITELAIGQTITLNIVADDYYGVANMQYNADIAISDESGGNFTGNSMYFAPYDLQEAGLESTLTAGGQYTLVIRIDAIGGMGYGLESVGCAKIVGATDSSSTYAFSMPANMVQMGGIVEVGSLNASVAVGNIPVVLPVACKNGNYVPTITVITDGTFKQIIADVANRTTTGFEICVRNIDTEAASNVKIAWSVVGLKG